jgi:uncharacterized membrane protein
MNALTRVKAISCDECSQPIHWWNRRVWLVKHERCAHLQCWNGRQFLHTYVQLMSDGSGNSQPRDNGAANAELGELRTRVQSLRESLDRLERRLQEAEKFAAKNGVNAVDQKGSAFGNSRSGYDS